jgi:hypothetical protein
MSYQIAEKRLLQEPGVELSTMMGSPCLRYRGAFMAAIFNRGDGMIIKVSPERVNELIAKGNGTDFDFTKKRFKEWVIIPLEFEEEYEAYLREALAYAKRKEEA